MIVIIDHETHEPPYVSLIPATTLAAIQRYVKEGQRGGDFLDAVVRNDLKGAFMHADEGNLEALRHIVRYFYNRVPAAAWGSREVMEQWCLHRGLAGLKEG